MSQLPSKMLLFVLLLLLEQLIRVLMLKRVYLFTMTPVKKAAS